tara:strand:+ start:9548 stop:11200 length:1653 start_codon:yes stop_codon:yes gene_type:complete
MARIPFNDSVITPRLQSSPQRQITGAATAITNRASAQLGQVVESTAKSVFESYGNRLKAQDESDMVAARAAFLRMQKEEDIAMQQTSNPEEIKKINGDYKKKYDSLAAGNDPQFNRPYFRNESGSNQFKELFSDNFHLRRDLSAKDQAFKLDRRNTHAGFINGIQAVRESNYYDRPIAAAETAEYIDKLQQHGFLTESEAAQKKQDSLHDLDLERAGRKLSEISAEPVADFNGTGVMNPVNMQVTQYKEYVNSLGNISDEQKKNFTKKADQIYSNAQKATKAAEKERGIQIEKDRNEYQTQAMIDIAEGKRTLSSLFSDPNISSKYKEKHLPRYIKKNDEYKKAIADDGKSLAASKKAFETKLWNDIIGSKLANKANSYDQTRHDDASGSVATALSAEIYAAPGMPSQTKTMLVGLIKNSSKVPPHIKDRKDNHIKDMERIFGLTKESFDVFKEAKGEVRIKHEVSITNWGADYFNKAFIDPKTGERVVDGLNEYKRRDALNRGILQYTSLMNQGKEKEAEEYIIKYKSDYELSENDTKLYDGYFKKVKK